MGEGNNFASVCTSLHSGVPTLAGVPILAFLGGTYLGEVPTLAWGYLYWLGVPTLTWIPTFAGGYLPWQEGRYLPYPGGTYLG